MLPRVSRGDSGSDRGQIRLSKPIRGAELSNGALSRTVFESEAREAFGELVKRYQNAAIAYASQF